MNKASQVIFGRALWIGVACSLLPLTAWSQVKTTLGGFVNTTFFYESVGETNTFSLDEVELDVESQLQPWAGFRFDLNFRAADSTRVNNDVLGTTFITFDDLSADDIMEQGYITLVLPTKQLGFESTFRFGKFNAPIGWELLDPVDLYQFSHALVFNFGVPFNVTGALIAMTFSPSVDVQIYAVNGWDQLNDNNRMKTFGGRLGLKPVDGINWGLSFITGPELDDNNEDVRTVFDTDLTVTLIPKLLIGAEFQYGFEENTAASGGDAQWLAGLLTLHYDFTDIIGLTFRLDVFDDQDGSRLPNDNPAVTEQTAYALTLAPTFVLAKGVRILAEVRYDQSDEDVFQKRSGRFVDSLVSVGVQFTYSFSHTFEILVKQ